MAAYFEVYCHGSHFGTFDAAVPAEREALNRYARKRHLYSIRPLY